jgi:hypothetical protein
MIRYALLCPQDHAFEAWFRDSDGFDRQNEAGQVCCPCCGLSDVRKAVMAPAVRRPSDKREPLPVPVPAPRTPPAPAPLSDVPFARLRDVLRDVHAKLKRDAVDVGPAFPEQARAIHDGEAPARAIYGTATDDEVRGLVEDGVPILSIPALPDDRN